MHGCWAQVGVSFHFFCVFVFRCLCPKTTTRFFCLVTNCLSLYHDPVPPPMLERGGGTRFFGVLATRERREGVFFVECVFFFVFVDVSSLPLRRAQAMRNATPRQEKRGQGGARAFASAPPRVCVTKNVLSPTPRPLFSFCLNGNEKNETVGACNTFLWGERKGASQKKGGKACRQQNERRTGQRGRRG